MYICIYIYIHLLWKGSPLLSCFGFFWKLSTSFGVSIKLGSFPSTFFGVFIKLGSFPSTPPLYPSHILKARPKNRHTYFQNTKLRTYVWYILAIFLLYTKSIHSHHGLRRTQLGNSGFFLVPPSGVYGSPLGNLFKTSFHLANGTPKTWGIAGMF